MLFMLCINFELILIKFGFCNNFFKLLKNHAKTPVTKFCQKLKVENSPF